MKWWVRLNFQVILFDKISSWVFLTNFPSDSFWLNFQVSLFDKISKWVFLKILVPRRFALKNSLREFFDILFSRENHQENILRANRQENFFKGKSSRDYVWGQIVKRLYLRANSQENFFKGKSSRDYAWGQIVKRIC